MSKINKKLLDIHTELDRAILDLAFFGKLNHNFHPAAAGDVSQVFSSEASTELASRFHSQASKWFPISKIEELAYIRADGRTDYRSEGVSNTSFYAYSKCLANRVMLITRTGSQIPAISQTILEGLEGTLLVLLEINDAGDAIRILFGNKQFGSIPSIETHVHILGGAIGIKEGIETPALVHAHPLELILLASHPRIKGNQDLFNAILYTQVEGINRIEPGLVALVLYKPSGSAILVESSISSLERHKIVIWLNHGVVVRASSIERGYAVMAYADRDAKVALQALAGKFVGLPFDVVESFLRQHNLLDSYNHLGLNK
ncbi:MAG: hypothetical protein A2406_01305 [Candidatus Komeilibacteria bacterium RIFOXYC1_FULL_37_11]|uniref:Class II aldolase/adducin N-terminal domain-containing protein n=1 Tax=Candidatus Komeilibacteria bacterium RIFOXYC1_FULL_37_11 TaxID=1798555 RepID=A0A1G2C397_9BACT|nr:MAG: hypothetical protein A2406_01305 [Candidatus Komeilibacteria bacterium RIFOXYC1_FULL_37_11]OGY95667.1 MAG: hypothetical protein A2611_02705 [Candidatus Komeilibacteria bacterium RIFOXYD1_FULL_37_29]OGY96338.1 MAG: hypothetical protein A2543_02620 [Candidatus Komeilibacteria bacterium RIFOXYD2_FULL_37_8]